MVSIAICDDEQYMSDKIRKLVSDFFAGKNIEIKILQFSNGLELLEYEKTIDILFLDIQMKALDGMETAKKLRSRNFKGFLIFITVLKEMVFKSFEVGAYDYLVKPVSKECFERTMERLFVSMQSSNEANLLIQRGYESNIISFDDIIYCEIINRKIHLHLRTGEIIEYYDRIERLEKKLDNRFYKCHRSYLVNLKYVKSYKNGMACLKDGGQIPISRLRNKEFSSVILQFIKEWRL